MSTQSRASQPPRQTQEPSASVTETPPRAAAGTRTPAPAQRRRHTETVSCFMPFCCFHSSIRTVPLRPVPSVDVSGRTERKKGRAGPPVPFLRVTPSRPRGWPRRGRGSGKGAGSGASARVTASACPAGPGDRERGLGVRARTECTGPLRALGLAGLPPWGSPRSKAKGGISRWP